MHTCLGEKTAEEVTEAAGSWCTLRKATGLRMGVVRTRHVTYELFKTTFLPLAVCELHGLLPQRELYNAERSADSAQSLRTYIRTSTYIFVCTAAYARP